MFPRFAIQTEPAVEPLTLVEAKAFLRVDGSDEDALISAMIKSARQAVEKASGLHMITQTWKMWMDSFPSEGSRRGVSDPWWDGVKEGPVSLLSGCARSIEIASSPVQSVTSVVTYDDDDAATTVSESSYRLDPLIPGLPARISLKTGESWPSDLRPANAICVTFVSGFGETGASVPEPLKHAMRLLVSHMFERRDPAIIGTSVYELPMSVDALIQQYRMAR